MSDLVYGALVSMLLFILFRSEELLAKMTRDTGIKKRAAVFLLCGGSLSLGAYLLSNGSARYISALFEFADRSECVFFGVGVLAFVGGVALLLSERIGYARNN